MIGAYETASMIMRDAAELTEKLIMDQLREFISRGLIVVERGPMKLTETRSGKIEMTYSVELKLSEQKYVEKLEAENKELRELLGDLGRAIEKAKKK